MTDKPHIHNEDELTDILYSAMERFNDVLNFDISAENTVVAFFTSKNAIDVYERFCNENF